jgi:predicted extracellular nuclease
MRRFACVLALFGCACASDPTPVPGVRFDGGPRGDAAGDATRAPVDATDAADPVDAAEPVISAPAPEAGAIRIATFNVHRLFDTVCDSGACAAGDYEEVETPAQLEARGARIARALAGLHVDVALVEEVESQASLDAIGAALPSLPSRVLGETGGVASVDVGVLAAFPITAVKGHRDQVLVRPDGTTTTFARELLEVHLDVHGQRVVVFAAHFRSKSSDDPGRRLAEAQAAHDIIAAVALDDPEALVVLGGDLNDVPGSPPIDALDAPYDGGALLRVAAGLPYETTTTYSFDGHGQAIDHLFLATASGATSRFVGGSFHVARDGGATTGLAGSDHAGIYADFGGF